MFYLMGRLRAVLLIVIAITAALLFVAPSSSAETGTIKVYYHDVQDIHVEFPDGQEIKKGGELKMIASSDVYDMEKTGIFFFLTDSNGKPDRTTKVTLLYDHVKDGNTVTYTFYGLTADVELDFVDSVLLDHKDIPIVPVEIIKIIGGDNLLTTIVIIASVAFGAVMLAFMALVIRMLDSYRYEVEMANEH